MKEWLIRLALLLGSLALVEGAARLFYHPAHSEGGDWHFEFDPAKNYRWKASLAGTFGSQPFLINAQHRVGRELPLRKPAGDTRVAVLGDSVSFGFNVPYEKSYVPLLESALNTKALNFGVPGYSTFQELADLRESEAYCPDLALVQFSFNDLVEPFLYLQRLGGLGIDYHRVPDASSLHFRLRGASRLYELVSDVLVKSAVARYGKEEMHRVKERETQLNERELVQSPATGHGPVAWKELRFWIAEMGAECRKAGLTCVFFPSPASLRFYHGGPEVEATVSELLAFARAQGFETLDPWPAFTAELGKEPGTDAVKKWNTLFLDDIHPNERGHALLARFLGEKLRGTLHPKACGEVK